MYEKNHIESFAAASFAGSNFYSVYETNLDVNIKLSGNLCPFVQFSNVRIELY